MTRRAKYRGIEKFSPLEGTTIIESLPAVGISHLNSKIEDGMAHDAALTLLKSRMYPLVNKLREFKRNGASRDSTDWWFPIVAKEDRFVALYAGANQHSTNHDSRKVQSSSLASNLGLTIKEFDMLTKATKGRWRKPKHLGFHVQFRKDQSIEWVLLDQVEETIDSHSPWHQSRGIRTAPQWIGYNEVDYYSVDSNQLHSAERKRQMQKETFRRTEYEDETESESENDPSSEDQKPKKLGRPMGSKDRGIVYELANGSLITVPGRYELISKYELCKLKKVAAAYDNMKSQYDSTLVTPLRNEDKNFDCAQQSSKRRKLSTESNSCQIQNNMLCHPPQIVREPHPMRVEYRNADTQTDAENGDIPFMILEAIRRVMPDELKLCSRGTAPKKAQTLLLALIEVQLEHQLLGILMAENNTLTQFQHSKNRFQKSIKDKIPCSAMVSHRLKKTFTHRGRLLQVESLSLQINCKTKLEILFI